MKAVILAGGLGTRLESVNKNTPKPMAEICKKPVLLHQLEALKREGISDFIFVVGHLFQQIKDFFGDGSAFGVNINYYLEKEPLGTAGALFELNLTEDFLLCNGDLIFDFSLKKMVEFHKKNNSLLTLLSHPNSHPFDSTLLVTNNDFLVTDIIKKGDKPFSYANLCNAGIQLVSPELLKLFPLSGKQDFDKNILIPAIKTGKVFAYKTTEYVKDMGTPQRLLQVESDLKNGVVANKNLSNPQRAIFLDRDGTINVHKGYITDPHQITLLPHVAQAIDIFHRLGYLVIVATNQPVIARGECTEETLKGIHNRMETLLGENGAFVDDIYYCPHHPDSGFENEVKELKILCNCRKPQPGLLLQAQKDYNIDMSKSFMVGDSDNDVQAAVNAGCTPVFIGQCSKEKLPQSTMCFSSLADFAKNLCK